MAKYRGTIRRSDLEGGFFQFQAEDGTNYEIDNVDADPLLKSDGAQVEIDGSVDKNAMSFTMSGPRLVVRSVKRV
jgi:hypothetical protein